MAYRDYYRLDLRADFSNAPATEWVRGIAINDYPENGFIERMQELDERIELQKIIERRVAGLTI